MNMLVSRPDSRRLMNDLVAHHFRGRPVSILEAGGGSHSKLALSQPERLKATLEGRGFVCDFFASYEGGIYNQMRRRPPLLGTSLGLATGMINALTPKDYNTRHGDFLAIFRKPSVEVA